MRRGIATLRKPPPHDALHGDAVHCPDQVVGAAWLQPSTRGLLPVLVPSRTAGGSMVNHCHYGRQQAHLVGAHQLFGATQMNIDPPGYRETFQLMKGKRYGWAVLVRGERNLEGGDPYSHIAVITVRDWEKAQNTGPYRWLNTHPNQPAPPEDTKALAIETWKRIKRGRL